MSIATTISYIWNSPLPELMNMPTEFVESVTDYCGGIVYEDSVLTRINLAGGYLRIADNSGNTLAKPEYHFYHRDHLGNNRMDLDGTTGAVHQITHYYPYGMPMDCGYIPAYQRWLFGDKEFDRTSGLDLYDFEARAYDPALGRFRQPDPLAESYRPLSPYLYCAANPLKNIDPTGKDYKVSVYNDKIIISANVYTVSHSLESAQHAAKIWNDQSGVYALDDRTIEFNINIISVDPNETIFKDVVERKDEKTVKYMANGDAESIGNTYLIATEKDSNINGGNQGGTVITVRPERAMTETGAHEFGHLLGLAHYDSGLMTPSSSDPNRNSYITGDMVKDIIKGAVKGKPVSGESVGKGKIEYNCEPTKFRYKIIKK